MNALATLRPPDRGPLICDVLTAGTPEAVERLRSALDELPAAERVLTVIDALCVARHRDDRELEARVLAFDREG